MSGGTTGLGILERALGNWPILESTLEGGPQQTLTPTFVSNTGALPRTTLNTFDSNAQAFGSLMLSSFLRGMVSFTHRVVRSRGRPGCRLPYGICRLTPLFCSVSGWNQSSWVNNSWKGGPSAFKNGLSWVDNSWSGEPSAPKNKSWVDLKKVPTRTGPRCAPSACNPC